MDQSPQEATRFSANQEIPHLYGTQGFIIVFRRIHHWTLSWGRWSQPTFLHSFSL